MDDFVRELRTHIIFNKEIDESHVKMYYEDSYKAKPVWKWKNAEQLILVCNTRIATYELLLDKIDRLLKAT